MAEEAKCRSCGAMIVWCKLVSERNPQGKPHPLDPVPTFEGSIERKRGKVSDAYYGRVVPKGERKGRRLYTSHFSTCPNAAQHRRPR